MTDTKQKQEYPIEVKEWIDDDEADKYECSVGELGGWFAKGHRWKDYIEAVREEIRPYCEAIRRSVIKNGLKITGDKHQHGGSGVPLFTDDTVGQFSYRAWGDLMAAIWSTEENRDSHYMEFYM